MATRFYYVYTHTHIYTHVQPSKCVAIMWKWFKYVHIANDYEHELPLRLNHQKLVARSNKKTTVMKKIQWMENLWPRVYMVESFVSCPFRAVRNYRTQLNSRRTQREQRQSALLEKCPFSWPIWPQGTSAWTISIGNLLSFTHSWITLSYHGSTLVTYLVNPPTFTSHYLVHYWCKKV